MKFIKDCFLFLPVFVLVFVVLVSCNNQKVSDKKDNMSGKTADTLVSSKNSSSGQQNTDTNKITETEDKASEIYTSYPKKIDAENARHIDSNNILHIDLLDSRIPVSQNKKIVEKLFPDCEVKYNKADIDYFDVFDIVCRSENNYTAMVSYEENLEGEKVIAFIFVKNTEFSMEMVRHLFKL